MTPPRVKCDDCIAENARAKQRRNDKTRHVRELAGVVCEACGVQLSRKKRWCEACAPVQYAKAAAVAAAERYKSDPAFRAQVEARKRARLRRRAAEDPVFAEKLRQRRRKVKAQRRAAKRSGQPR